MQIKINNLTWTIVVKNSEELKEIDREVWGLADLTTQTIYLNSDMHSERVDFVLIHELTHAFIYSYGFDQVKMNTEIYCDFVGTYGRNIITATDKILNVLKLEESGINFP